MFRRFVSSCFHKRSERLPPESPHFDAPTETDSSDATFVHIHSTLTHKTSTDRVKASTRGETEAHAQPKNPVMPKSAKQKSAQKPAKNRKPYLRTHTGKQAARSTPMIHSTNGLGTGGLGKSKELKDTEVNEALEAIFDSLLPETEDEVTKDKVDEPAIKGAAAAKPQKNELDMAGVEAYLHALGIDLGMDLGYSFFVLADIVQMQSFGQITRHGFVQGWKQAWNESKVFPNMAAHKDYLWSRIDLVRTDTDYFKRVYRSAFAAGKEPGKREIDMDVALAYWADLFAPTMHGWKTANADWLEAWKEYLTQKFWVKLENKDKSEKPAQEAGGGEQANQGKWTRTVSKDLWNQTLVFAAKTLEDETLGFWSEEQAWPGLIDEFVIWCREKGIVGGKNGERMVTEE